MIEKMQRYYYNKRELYKVSAPLSDCGTLFLFPSRLSVVIGRS